MIYRGDSCPGGLEVQGRPNQLLVVRPLVRGGGGAP